VLLHCEEVMWSARLTDIKINHLHVIFS